VAWIKPPKLVVGDWVGVVAPSDAVTQTYLSKGIELLESWGLKVKLGKNIFRSDYDFAAGDPWYRWQDLTTMVGDFRIKAVWASNGGYAATQLWPYFSDRFFSDLAARPKWFIGYSDVCTILNALVVKKIVSIHGPNLSGLPYWDISSQEWIRKMLFGEIDKNSLAEWTWKMVIPGEASGRLLVSNLDTLITCFGNKFDPLENGNENLILGIEEYNQYKSNIQRQMDMIMNHKKSWRIKGIVLGRMTNLFKDKGYKEWEKQRNVLDVIKDRVLAVKDIPIVSFSDFGHAVRGGWLREHFPLFEKPQTFLGLPNGIRVQLNVMKKNSFLKILEPICD